jgi:hypothetical protein
MGVSSRCAICGFAYGAHTIARKPDHDKAIGLADWAGDWVMIRFGDQGFTEAFRP